MLVGSGYIVRDFSRIFRFHEQLSPDAFAGFCCQYHYGC